MATSTPTRPRSRQKEPSITSVAGLPFDPMMVQLKHCRVDDTYQRDEQPSLVREIAEDFHPGQAGSLVLSRRGASDFAIVDGQQRWRGMTQRGIKEWFGIVFTGLNQEEEADLYARLFNRKAMHSADKFKANLARKVPDVVAVNGILTDLDFAIGKNSGKPEIITAPGAILWIYRGCTSSTKREERFDHRLVMTLEIIVAAWPDRDKTVKGELMLKGLALFLKQNNDDVDQEKLILRLSHTTASKLWEDAQNAAKGQRKAVTSDRPGWMAHAIGTLYNQKNWKP